MDEEHHDTDGGTFSQPCASAVMVLIVSNMIFIALLCLCVSIQQQVTDHKEGKKPRVSHAGSQTDPLLPMWSTSVVVTNPTTTTTDHNLQFGVTSL